MSQFLFYELLDVCNRPVLQAKFDVSAEQAAAFIHDLLRHSNMIDVVPEVFAHAVDPDDSHYVNLALATGSELIVSRDKHLLNLGDSLRPEGKAFKTQFPFLRILQPQELLVELAK